MKWIKVILLLFLIIKVSTDIDSFVLDILIDQSHSSCHTSISICDDSGDTSSDEDGCCEGACDCLCCGHVFTLNASDYQVSIHSNTILKSDFSFDTNYHYLFSVHVWQPPQEA